MLCRLVNGCSLPKETNRSNNSSKVFCCFLELSAVNYSRCGDFISKGFAIMACLPNGFFLLSSMIWDTSTAKLGPSLFLKSAFLLSSPAKCSQVFLWILPGLYCPLLLLCRAFSNFPPLAAKQLKATGSAGLQTLCLLCQRAFPG